MPTSKKEILIDKTEILIDIITYIGLIIMIIIYLSSGEKNLLYMTIVILISQIIYSIFTYFDIL